jgi:HEAT repeat protein
LTAPASEPAEQTRLRAALASPDPKAKIEALEAWADRSPGPLPPEAIELVRASDPRVRAAALRAVARCRPPQAEQRLIEALDDLDLQVRLAAVSGLGVLGGVEPRTALERLRSDRGELIRAAAVNALARMSDAQQAVLRAKDDPSWRVRLAVAEALEGYADRPGTAAARQLLDDPSPTVSNRVVAVVNKWPPGRAAPVLWEAMGKDTYLTRQNAARQLAAVWPPAAEFPVDGTPRQRADFLRRHQPDFRRQFPEIDAGAVAEAAGATRATAARAVAPERLAHVESLLDRLADPAGPRSSRQSAAADLARLGPDLIPALEHLTLDEKRVLPEAIFREVLPGCGPEFGALDQLASDDVQARRRAGARLAELARQRPLGPLALHRLAALGAKESDVLVWRSVLGAVAADGTEPSIRLACAGLSHPSPEVRRLACEHLAAHAQPGNAPALIPVLDDAHGSVVLAAVRAVGAAGDARAAEPLKRLLASPSEWLRLDVAVALARLGDPSGPAALDRLAYSNDPAVRRQAAAAMGEIGDPSFAATLVRLLDDQHAVRLAALASLPKVTGRVPPEPDGQSAPSLAERIEFWKRAVGRGQ